MLKLSDIQEPKRSKIIELEKQFKKKMDDLPESNNDGKFISLDANLKAQSDIWEWFKGEIKKLNELYPDEVTV